jgi:hypothetical protein
VSLKALGRCLEITFSEFLGSISENSAASGVEGVKIGVPSGTDWTTWIMLDFSFEEESAAAVR